LQAYGGPLSSLTVMKYSFVEWATYLSSAQEIIVATTDGRGTDARGCKFRWAIYERLGEKEVTDQLILARYLSKQSYVDARLIAIQGWSYGGYLTAKMMQRNEPLVRIGISVAPVYSWKAYDSLYTERYMGLLVSEEDRKRYALADVAVTRKEAFKDFLLIQGTGDDNVHFLNSMLFQMDLTDQGAYPSIQHRVFADSNHHMNRNNDRKVLHEIMTNFLLDTFERNSSQ
jgi:dipeptidyl aminopeptidase/acylaminoacyl peptidase